MRSWLKYLLILSSVIFSSNALAKPPLVEAAQRGNQDRVLELLSSGVDVNEAERFGGWTALHYAAFGVLPEMVDDLIAAQANPDLRLREGRTAFELTLYHFVITLLEPSVHYNAPTQQRHAALFERCAAGHTTNEALRLMVEELKLYYARILHKLVVATMKHRGIQGDATAFALQMIMEQVSQFRAWLSRSPHHTPEQAEQAIETAANLVLAKFSQTVRLRLVAPRAAVPVIFQNVEIINGLLWPVIFNVPRPLERRHSCGF